MIDKQACIFGGSGFIGRQIVRELARQGFRVRIASRAAESAYFLRTAGDPGQIVPLNCDYNDATALRGALRGCQVVVNCVGILAENRKGDFEKIHTRLPATIAAACALEKVERLVHMSALACDKGQSAYAQSKFAGEQAVFENFPAATILRPSIVFGPEDNFFNKFAKLSVAMPALPLIGGGHTKFQPVYVGDIAEGVSACLRNGDTKGRIFELGGPEILTFRQLYERLFAQTGRPKMLISLPWGIAKIQGCVLGMLPGKMLTVDQVESLKTDNIVDAGAAGFADLGIAPTTLDAILPSYLSRYRPGGRFADKKRA